MLSKSNASPPITGAAAVNQIVVVKVKPARLFRQRFLVQLSNRPAFRALGCAVAFT
jgi:hypothetical protein